MLILTVTLNPALDKTICIDNFSLNQVNRVDSVRLDAGGKGINVSNTISAMGRKSVAYGVIGGQTGGFIKEALAKEGIEFKYLETIGETRTNLKIVDVINETHTDINEPGQVVEEEFETKILEMLESDISMDDVLIIGGSLLPGLTSKMYRRLTQLAFEKGAKVILDTEGEQLEQALQASPHIIKPNIFELSGLAGKELSSNDEVIDFSRNLIADGKVQKGILVSMGEEGALWITKESIIKVEAIKTEVKSTVGAGDAMVAALAIAMDEGFEDEDMLKLATAAAVARISSDGPISCSMDQIKNIASKVILKKVN